MIRRAPRAALAAVLGLVAAWSAAAAVFDAWGARPPPPGPYDYVVVAGAGVNPGGVAGPSLAARTARAAELWRAGVAPRVAFTGGVGDWGPAESVVAAELAAGWGVPRDVMIGEARSTSTEENAADLRAVIGDASILVVTDRYHVARCTRVFGRHFSHVAAEGVESPPLVRIRGAYREVLASAWYVVTGRW